MSSSKDRFVFYEYLIFFWKKKWWLVLAPLLGVILALGLSALGEKSYVGSLTFYTGNVIKEELLHPLLLEENYEIEGLDLTINRSEKIITFTSVSSDKDLLEEKLGEIEVTYGENLKENSRGFLESIQKRLDYSINRKETLEQSIALYKDKLETPGIDTELETEYLSTINKTEQILFDYIDQINTEEQEIQNYEEPQKISLVVSEKSSFLTSNLLLGFIVGLFLGLGFVTLWKYILDARRITHNN